MKNNFKLYTYKDYKLLISSITNKREDDFPDIYQELFLAVCEMEKDIFENKIKIRNNNLFNYVYGYLKRTYLNLGRNNKRNKKENKVRIIEKDLSEMEIIDNYVKSEEEIIENIYLQEELVKKNLTEQEAEFYFLYNDSSYSKKYIKQYLNIDEIEYNKLRNSIRWKIKGRQQRRNQKLQP